jgi:hypothetical protein
MLASSHGQGLLSGNGLLFLLADAGVMSPLTEDLRLLASPHRLLTQAFPPGPVEICPWPLHHSLFAYPLSGACCTLALGSRQIWGLREVRGVLGVLSAVMGEAMAPCEPGGVPVQSGNTS